MDIENEIEEVLLTHKYLEYNGNKNQFFGELYIDKFDSYDIIMQLNGYPSRFPIVTEINGRIPKKLHRHIYTDTGSCCLTTTAKSQVLLKTKITSLTLFIDKILIPYFQNNSYYEINSKYKTDEYSHGVLGVIEGYRDILKINNDFLIAKLMYNRILGIKLKISNLCYCNSGKTLKKCHFGLHDRLYRDFKKINKTVLLYDFNTYFKNHLKL